MQSLLKETSFRSSSFSSCLACFRRSAQGGRERGKKSQTYTVTPYLSGRGTRLFTRCFPAELAQTARSPTEGNPTEKGGPHREGGALGDGGAPHAERGFLAGHPQALSPRPGGSGAGCRSLTPGPPRRRAQPDTDASWLRGRQSHRSLRARAAPGPRRRAEGTSGGSAVPGTGLYAGRAPRTANAPSPPPSGPTRLPSSCCSPPPSLLSNVSRGPARPRRREGRTRASSWRRGARRDGRTSRCSAPKRLSGASPPPPPPLCSAEHRAGRAGPGPGPLRPPQRPPSSPEPPLPVVG